MQINDIENMGVEELTEQHDELVEVAKTADVGGLASRYIQARTDAKKRDVLLGKQGRTITTLNDSLEAAKEHAEELASAHLSEIESAVKRISVVEAERDVYSKAREEVMEKFAILQEKLNNEVKLSSKLRVQAQKFASAISSISKITVDAIQSQVIDEAGNTFGD